MFTNFIVILIFIKYLFRNPKSLDCLFRLDQLIYSKKL